MSPTFTSALGQLTLVVAGYAALVAVAAVVCGARRVPRPAWLDQMAWILELLVAVRVVAGVGSMLKGQRPEEMSSHLGYLVASLCLVPIAVQAVSDDRGPWSSAVVAVVAVAVGVVAIRLQMTWGHG